MASINKKKIALIEKYNQEKLRNKALRLGVTLKSSEQYFYRLILNLDKTLPSILMS